MYSDLALLSDMFFRPLMGTTRITAVLLTLLKLAHAGRDISLESLRRTDSSCFSNSRHVTWNLYSLNSLISGWDKDSLLAHTLAPRRALCWSRPPHCRNAPLADILGGSNVSPWNILFIGKWILSLPESFQIKQVQSMNLCADHTTKSWTMLTSENVAKAKGSQPLLLVPAVPEMNLPCHCQWFIKGPAMPMNALPIPQFSSPVILANTSI